MEAVNPLLGVSKTVPSWNAIVALFSEWYRGVAIYPPPVNDLFTPDKTLNLGVIFRYPLIFFGQRLAFWKLTFKKGDFAWTAWLGTKTTLMIQYGGWITWEESGNGYSLLTKKKPSICSQTIRTSWPLNKRQSLMKKILNGLSSSKTGVDWVAGDNVILFWAIQE